MRALFLHLQAAWAGLRHGPDGYARRLLRERDAARAALDRIVRDLVLGDPESAKLRALEALESGTAGGSIAVWGAVRKLEDEPVAKSSPKR